VTGSARLFAQLGQRIFQPLLLVRKSNPIEPSRHFREGECQHQADHRKRDDQFDQGEAVSLRGGSPPPRHRVFPSGHSCTR
jgi:hypothetical protein